jgi:hypothetical protein
MKRLLSTFVLVLIVGGTLSAQTLRTYQIDVEQADSALFVMPKGKTV